METVILLLLTLFIYINALEFFRSFINRAHFFRNWNIIPSLWVWLFWLSYFLSIFWITICKFRFFLFGFFFRMFVLGFRLSFSFYTNLILVFSCVTTSLLLLCWKYGLKFLTTFILDNGIFLSFWRLTLSTLILFFCSTSKSALSFLFLLRFILFLLRFEIMRLTSICWILLLCNCTCLCLIGFACLRSLNLTLSWFNLLFLSKLS